MARFSLGDEADERERSDPSSSSSRPTPKRQKLTVSPQPQPSQPAVDAPIQTNALAQVAAGDAEVADSYASGYDSEAEDARSANEEQEGEDEAAAAGADQEACDQRLPPHAADAGEGI